MSGAKAVRGMSQVKKVKVRNAKNVFGVIKLTIQWEGQQITTELDH